MYDYNFSARIFGMTRHKQDPFFRVVGALSRRSDDGDVVVNAVLGPRLTPIDDTHDGRAVDAFAADLGGVVSAQDEGLADQLVRVFLLDLQADDVRVTHVDRVVLNKRQ